MKDWLNRIGYVASTTLFSLLATLFAGVFLTSLGKNAIDMYSRIGLSWQYPGNYAGLIAGFIAYGLFIAALLIFRRRHNLEWAMKFTHELTHTLMALLFWRKIHEFVVKGRECYVYYEPGRLGYTPITLSPYCIPIYTFMIFPFRFAGDRHFMIIFDALIAFTYAFHVHSYIKQTRLSQSDIKNCGIAKSISFLAFVHLAVISLILATPKGGVLNALYRVFWEYPYQILTNTLDWAKDILQYFSI